MRNFLRLILFLVPFSVSAQDFSCATDVIEQSMITTNPDYAQERAQLEQFTQQYRNGFASRMINMGCQKTAAIYYIPIVFHVMHLGEPIGVGSNIPDTQIVNSVTRMNSYWLPLGIQFVLAKQAPDGGTSTGINRINCSAVPNFASVGIDPRTNPTGTPDTVIRKMAMWPYQNYQNVWVVAKAASSNAYSNMPGSYQYQGIVLIYGAIAAQTTLSHEMGHYFNLLHPFQGSTSTVCAPNDDPYNQGDKCADTPPVKQTDCASSSCGTFSNVNNSLMNIMGYCYKPNPIYTPDQKTRVMASLFSEYRWSLVSSPGLIPTNVTTEVAVDSIAFVQNLSQPTCNGIVTPQIQIKNYGNTVNSLELLVSIDNIDTTIVVSPGFTRGSVNWLSLPLKTFSTSGSHSITVEVKKVNGVTDYNAFNNVQCMSFNVIVQTVTISTVMNTPAAGSFTGGGTFSCSGINDTIRVTTNPGYIFQNIKEGSTIVSTNPTYVIPIDLSQGNRTFTAYHAVQTFAINVSVNGIGGTVSGGGLSIAYGSSTTVTANNFSCWDFVGWYENNVLVSSSKLYTFPVYSARNLVAKFTPQIYTVTAIADNVANGTVAGSGTYGCDTKVTVTAIANACYTFVKWTENGNTVSTSAGYSFDITASRNLVANFVKKTFEINVSPNDVNKGIVSGGGRYGCDTMVTLNANAKAGFRWLNWTENTTVVSSDSVYTFNASANRTLVANFEQIVTGVRNTINEISKIYPNPTSDILRVEILSKQSSTIMLQILDMKGCILQSKTLVAASGKLNTSFDVSRLANGNYILHLQDEEGIVSYQFSIQ